MPVLVDREVLEREIATFLVSLRNGMGGVSPAEQVNLRAIIGLQPALLRWLAEERDRDTPVPNVIAGTISAVGHLFAAVVASTNLDPKEVDDVLLALCDHAKIMVEQGKFVPVGTMEAGRG